MLPYILGTRVLSEVNVIVALIIYGVAVMVRSAADALAAVDSTTRQAATAMGYSSWTRFWAVELPLAGPVLLAGLRVVSVSTIALVSVGAIIGSRNLGYLFLNGRQRNNLEEILVGIVASVLIALLFDFLLVRLGKLAMPWHDTTRARAPLPRLRRYAVRGGA
jgi:osmoprotectant transport system permease protein